MRDPGNEVGINPAPAMYQATLRRTSSQKEDHCITSFSHDYNMNLKNLNKPKQRRPWFP